MFSRYKSSRAILVIDEDGPEADTVSLLQYLPYHRLLEQVITCHNPSSHCHSVKKTLELNCIKRKNKSPSKLK